MKKKEGSVDKIAIALMTIIIGGILTFTNIAFTQAMETKAQLNAVVREYLLDLESNGWVAGINDNNTLKSELEQMKVSDKTAVVVKYYAYDVNTGSKRELTSSSKVKYGEQIEIVVTGAIPITQYDYKEGQSIVEIPFEITRKTVAKVVNQ